MPLDSSGGRGGGGPARNVLGSPIETCSMKPMTGFFRNGCCDTGPEDSGQPYGLRGDDRGVPVLFEGGRQRSVDAGAGLWVSRPPRPATAGACARRAGRRRSRRARRRASCCARRMRARSPIARWPISRNTRWTCPDPAQSRCQRCQRHSGSDAARGFRNGPTAGCAPTGAARRCRTATNIPRRTQRRSRG